MTEAGWTSNAPTKEGWYWWQRTENDNPVVVWVNTFHPDKQLRAEMISGRRELLTHFSGLFKGPISPDSYQQGRVAALDEVERYMAMRLRLAEASLATEILARNEVKQGRERAAIAELHGMQRHVSDIKEYLAQQAQEGGVGE